MVWAAAIALAAPAFAATIPLEDRVGRSEVRVRSAPFPLVAGRTVAENRIPERLERLGYRRVHRRPEAPGEYFWGHDLFWVFRRAHRLGGIDHPPSRIGLRLDGSDRGRILGAVGRGGRRHPLERPGLLWLEPETLSESLTSDDAPRRPVRLDELPEHVWRAVLAAEDARFFEHAGLDAISLARAALANLQAGRVTQGGSTITQQLIKNRDLTPKRTLGRKLSEAVRALALEAEYPKREILQAYLNRVYLGHVGGLAIRGVGAAARAYFSSDATELTLGEAAVLAGMIQGPNRLTPLRHPERARRRRDLVLERMAEFGWASAEAAGRAKAEPIRLRSRPPAVPRASHFVTWAAQVVPPAGKAAREGRGVVLETTLDPLLQDLAERAVREGLARLRRQHRRLTRVPLSAALVALDAGTGEVLAYVGGDPPAGPGKFDHARSARRPPGSTVKPLVLLEAFEACADRGRPLHAASRVRDEPLRLDLPSGAWEPANHDGRFRGTVDVRQALEQSLNVPFVRIARACGFEATARRMRRAGLALPADHVPPSLALGALEVSPLQLAEAYTVFATPGRRLSAGAVRRAERPGGRTLHEMEVAGRRVVRPATAYVVRNLMRGAVDRGTAGVARIEGLDVAAKTGTTRDAWFAGHAGPLVTVTWVGIDEREPLGLSGAVAAGPIWREFMRQAVPARPARTIVRPPGVLERRVDPRTGLRVGNRNRRGRPELFRRGVVPPRDRFWRPRNPEPVLD